MRIAQSQRRQSRLRRRAVLEPQSKRSRSAIAKPYLILLENPDADLLPIDSLIANFDAVVDVQI